MEINRETVDKFRMIAHAEGFTDEAMRLLLDSLKEATGGEHKYVPPRVLLQTLIEQARKQYENNPREKLQAIGLDSARRVGELILRLEAEFRIESGPGESQETVEDYEACQDVFEQSLPGPGRTR